MKITEEFMQEFAFGEGEDKKYEGVDYEELGLNSHGVLMTLAVVKNKSNGKLYGYIYEQLSEENLYDYDELFELESEEVTVTKYKRVDGKRLF